MVNFSQMLKTREPTLLDRDDGHWYKTKFDNVYPSVNTILSATASDEKKIVLPLGKKMSLHMSILLLRHKI